MNYRHPIVFTSNLAIAEDNVNHRLREWGYILLLENSAIMFEEKQEKKCKNR